MADALAAAGVTGLLAEREEALADLYQTYAWRFSDYRMLWNDLRADELVHAGWARSLADVTGAADAFDNASDEAGVTESLACVRDALVRVRNGQVSACEALAAALGFERSMLAEGLFDCAPRAPRDPVAAALLKAMRSSTVDHLERVRAAYESAARVAS